MNITLSIDEKLLTDARNAASKMGKSLNQLIRDDLKRLTHSQSADKAFYEFKSLSGKGDSSRWKYNREELHERA